MKKLFGLCAMMALITGGVVLSDEVKSIVEQDAAQAVESAVDDSNAAPVQEALPEQEAVPEQTVPPTPADVVEEVLPDSSQPTPPAANAPYILGVIASPVPPMVRAQVNIPEESGLFVQTIKPNGPAAKAGVLPYDIILSVDGAAISSTIDLAAAIQKAAGKPQKLTVLRQGKELTLDVTAQLAEAPRQPRGLMLGTPVPQTPQPFIDPMAPNYDPDEDEDNLDPSFPRIQQFMDRQRQQMDQMRQRMEAMENAMRQGMPGFFPFAPGAVPTPAPAPNGVLTPAPAPAPNGGMVLPPQMNDPNAQVQRDSFSVQVQKNGNEPAIIKIQENGNEYIVDENSIDQLPENVRNRLNFKIKTNDK
ncbi:MAG: PDZ domain-containing protein [Thermoguttaceae bacterium]|nr:PDZ domain-containing protein [Thermoguttaceae bacterium]